MVIFHLHILSTFPLAVPLEWNVFMIFGVLFLFGHYGDVPWSTLDDPLLIAILAVTCVGIPILGNFRPDLISFLPSMRYYAGNWATSQWLFSKESERREEARPRGSTRSAPIVVEQLRELYDDDLVEVLVYKGLAFRSMHSHGRALNGLLPRAVDDVEAYDVREGEIVAGVVLGYNFGDGHFHNQRPARGGAGALPLRARASCGWSCSSPSPPTMQRQRYRIYDAADGPGRGGLGRGRRHGRAPALARRRAVPGPAPHERGGRRRRRPQRAGLRGDPGEPRGRGDGDRGRRARSAAAPAAAS